MAEPVPPKVRFGVLIVNVLPEATVRTLPASTLTVAPADCALNTTAPPAPGSKVKLLWKSRMLPPSASNVIVLLPVALNANVPLPLPVTFNELLLMTVMNPLLFVDLIVPLFVSVLPFTFIVILPEDDTVTLGPTAVDAAVAPPVVVVRLVP